MKNERDLPDLSPETPSQDLTTRRDAIKYLIAGSMMAACPIPLSAMQEAEREAPVKLGSENNAKFHRGFPRCATVTISSFPQRLPITTS